MSIFERLQRVLSPPITSADFRDFRALRPKRICFSSTHKDALKSKDGLYAGTLSLPFSETIETVLPWKIYKSNFGGYYRGIKTEEEFAEVKRWIEERRTFVFIRSLMNTAMAAGEHFAEDGTRSYVGSLERAAKYDENVGARLELQDLLHSVFRHVHSKLEIDAIVAIPASKPGAASLPAALVTSLSERTGIINASDDVRWNGIKAKIKETAVDAKWTSLENTGLTIDTNLKGKNILLVDDMYQSGSTVHFVASCLRKAGANDIHCLAVSKGRRDTDNT